MIYTVCAKRSSSSTLLIFFSLRIKSRGLNIYICIYIGLNGGVTLVGGSETPESGPIILVDFKIVMFSASGLKVDALTLSGIICIIIYM